MTGCDGVVRVAYIRSVVDGVRTWHPVGEYCDGCEVFWPGLRRPRARVDFVNAAHGRVGRNAPCPCGSGMKYKRCHGA